MCHVSGQPLLSMEVWSPLQREEIRQKGKECTPLSTGSPRKPKTKELNPSLSQHPQDRPKSVRYLTKREPKAQVLAVLNLSHQYTNLAHFIVWIFTAQKEHFCISIANITSEYHCETKPFSPSCAGGFVLLIGAAGSKHKFNHIFIFLNVQFVLEY